MTAWRDVERRYSQGGSSSSSSSSSAASASAEPEAAAAAASAAAAAAGSSSQITAVARGGETSAGWPSPERGPAAGRRAKGPGRSPHVESNGEGGGAGRKRARRARFDPRSLDQRSPGGAGSGALGLGGLAGRLAPLPPHLPLPAPGGFSDRGFADRGFVDPSSGSPGSNGSHGIRGRRREKGKKGDDPAVADLAAPPDTGACAEDSPGFSLGFSPEHSSLLAELAEEPSSGVLSAVLLLWRCRLAARLLDRDKWPREIRAWTVTLDSALGNAAQAARAPRAKTGPKSKKAAAGVGADRRGRPQRLNARGENASGGFGSGFPVRSGQFLWAEVGRPIFTSPEGADCRCASGQ